jgi:hypothetical protein
MIGWHYVLCRACSPYIGRPIWLFRDNKLGSIAASFRRPSKVLPEYCLYDFALCRSAYTIVYLLFRVLVCVVVYILPNILGFIGNGVLEVILVVGVIYRYLDYPSASFNSSDLLA